jgi:hypothetical protein
MGTAEKEIFWFLNKNYYIKEQRFFNKFDNNHEWGYEIANLLSNIFSYGLEKSKELLSKWAYENDMPDKAFELAYNRQKLKVKWTPEMAMDLIAMYQIDSAEEQITKILTEEIVKEIDAQILIDLREEIKTPNDLLGVVKCLGYETTPTIYDPMTFTPQKNFVSTNYNEMIAERQNNPFWIKWTGENLEN